MTNLAFVDVETGGLDPMRSPLIEVAIILRPEDELIHFSLPFDFADCTPQAIEIAKLRERKAELDLIREHVFDAIGILKDAFKPERVFIGNNPQFDAAFLSTFMRRGGVAPDWHYHLVDIKALVAGKYGVEPQWSSRQIAELAGVSLPTAAHTAVADCEWNREVYYHAVFNQGGTT